MGGPLSCGPSPGRVRGGGTRAGIYLAPCRGLSNEREEDADAWVNRTIDSLTGGPLTIRFPRWDLTRVWPLRLSLSPPPLSPPLPPTPSPLFSVHTDQPLEYTLFLYFYRPSIVPSSIQLTCASRASFSTGQDTRSSTHVHVQYHATFLDLFSQRTPWRMKNQHLYLRNWHETKN